jgi:hypothetical protein
LTNDGKIVSGKKGLVEVRPISEELGRGPD